MGGMGAEIVLGCKWSESGVWLTIFVSQPVVKIAVSKPGTMHLIIALLIGSPAVLSKVHNAVAQAEEHLVS